MRAVQAVPQVQRLGLPPVEIEGISPVAQFLVRERESVSGGLLEIGVSLVGNLPTAAVS